jgi:hypothetical protein
MKMKGMKCLGIRKRYAILLLAASILQSVQTKAQQANGQGGISAANQQVGSYFDIGCTLMYSIGAIVGLIGAVKVYQKWSHGDHDTSKVAAAWFGACIFLVVVAAILKGFFGVQ